MIALRRMCTKVNRKTERIKTISHRRHLLRWWVVIEGFLPNTAAHLLAKCKIFSAVCTCYCRLHHLTNNSAYLVFSFARQVLLEEIRATRSVMFMWKYACQRFEFCSQTPLHVVAHVLTAGNKDLWRQQAIKKMENHAKLCNRMRAVVHHLTSTDQVWNTGNCLCHSCSVCARECARVCARASATATHWPHSWFVPITAFKCKEIFSSPRAAPSLQRWATYDLVEVFPSRHVCCWSELELGALQCAPNFWVSWCTGRVFFSEKKITHNSSPRTLESTEYSVQTRFRAGMKSYCGSRIFKRRINHIQKVAFAAHLKLQRLLSYKIYFI